MMLTCKMKLLRKKRKRNIEICSINNLTLTTIMAMSTMKSMMTNMMRRMKMKGKCTKKKYSTHKMPLVCKFMHRELDQLDIITVLVCLEEKELGANQLQLKQYKHLTKGI